MVIQVKAEDKVDLYAYRDPLVIEIREEDLEMN